MVARILFFVNLILLVFIWAYTFFTYQKLPDIIPIHFGIDGQPDGYGKKTVNYIFAGIATFIFLFMNSIGKDPESPLLNVPDSMRKRPVLIRFFIQTLLFFCMLIFSLITLESTNVALGNDNSLTLVIPAILVLMFVYMFGFFYYVKKLDKK